MAGLFPQAQQAVPTQAPGFFERLGVNPLGLAAGFLQAGQQGIGPAGALGQAIPLGFQFQQAQQQSALNQQRVRAQIQQQQQRAEQQRQAQEAIQNVLGGILGGPQPVGPVIDGIAGQAVQDGIQPAVQPGQQLDPLAISQAALQLGAIPGTGQTPQMLAQFSQNLQQQRGQALTRRRESITAAATLFEKGFAPQLDPQGNLISATSPSGNVLNPRQVKLADTLSRSFDANKTTTRTGAIVDSFSRLSQAALNPSAAGDLAMIFGFMKILDPTSVVREGEFANAQNTGSVPQRTWALYNRILSGERLTPPQRQDFVNQAVNVTRGQINSQKRVNSTFSKRARRREIEPQDILSDFEGQFNQINEQLQQVQRPPVTQEDLEFTARQRGITVEQVREQLRQRGVQTP